MSLDQTRGESREHSDSMNKRVVFSPEISRLYQGLREAAIQRGEMKRRAAFAKHEKLKKADLLVREAGGRQLEASLRSADAARLARIELNDAIAMRWELLRDLGYDASFDEADYQCKICGDTGVDGDKPCVCYKTVAYPVLFEESNMQDVAGHRFEYFDASIFSDQVETFVSAKKPVTRPSSRELHQRLLETAEAYCRDFDPEEADSFLYYGPTGTGKTFLAACIGNELLTQGYRVYFISFTEMMQKLAQYRILMNSFNPDPLKLDRAELFCQRIHDIDLLIIDDLGSAPGDSGTHSSEMIQLLDNRFAHKKPILITSNLDLEKIQKRYDERLLSRLLGSMKPVRFYGTDVRIHRDR